MWGKRFRIHFFILMVFLSLLALSPPICGSELTIIEGEVVEDLTNNPVQNATVALWTEGGSMKANTKTDVEGHFRIVTEGGFDCRVYAYCDVPNTPGLDFVPSVRSFYLKKGSETNISFRLVSGASVILEGDLLFVESSEPPFLVNFTVIDPDSGSPLSGDDRVYNFDNGHASHNYLLGLNFSHVVVPADEAINIKVNSTVLLEDKRIYRVFTLDCYETINLSRGESIHIDVRKCSLQFNLNLIKDYVSSIESRLNETGRLGFYIAVETRDFDKIGELLEKAEFELIQVLYDECYADLREIYINAENLYGELKNMRVEASISAYTLIFFLVFTATTIAHLFLEISSHKALATCILYALFLFVLHRVFPGFLIIKTAILLQVASISLGLALIVTFILPNVLKERTVKERIAFRSAVTAVFSMAKRNLKRRKFRFMLTITTVTVLVMSFVTLTSFSTGYGLIARPLETVTPSSEGLRVMKPPPNSDQQKPVVDTFTPLTASDINWTMRKPETLLVAPKAENFPELLPIGTLALSDEPEKSIQLSGVLGILPSAESKITNIDRIIVEGGGSYLRDNEENAVLISVKAAEKLNARIGDILNFQLKNLNMEVRLTGFFDDDLFSQLRDLDGAHMSPMKVIAIDEGFDVPPKYEVVLCDPSEIVITTWQAALTPGSWIFLSRIDVLVKETEDILPLARRMALERDYWVWASVGGQVYLTSLKSYFEAKGLPVMIPWLIVIFNVVTTMLNAIFERRREISILSSIGLNPSHITALFVAEATMIGIIGGGIGYLSGLALYRLMSALSIALEVRQKVSAVWCLGALGISATAVVIGAIVAIRGSVIITPSLLRRWRVEEKPHNQSEPWVFTLPFEVRNSNINQFMAYVRSHLELYKNGVNPNIGRVRQVDDETPKSVTKRIKFTYFWGKGTLDGFLTINELVAIERREEEVYALKLISKGDEGWVYKTASFIRELILRWSAVKEDS